MTPSVSSLVHSTVTNANYLEHSLANANAGIIDQNSRFSMRFANLFALRFNCWRIGEVAFIKVNTRHWYSVSMIP